MLAQKIAAYESARRAAVLLWRAKRDLVDAAQARFNKTHPVTLAVARLTHHDPTCVIRSIADDSACVCADRLGEDIFRRTVDGIDLPAVTAWFYGTICPPPSGRRALNRTKTFTYEDALLWEEFCIRAALFCGCVWELPFVNRKRLQREENRLNKLIIKAEDRIHRYSPVCYAYAKLPERLASQVARLVVSYW